MPVRSQFRYVLPAISAILAIGLVLAIALHSGGSSDDSKTPNVGRSGDFDGAAFPAGVRAALAATPEARAGRVPRGSIPE